MHPSFNTRSKSLFLASTYVACSNQQALYGKYDGTVITSKTFPSVPIALPAAVGTQSHSQVSRMITSQSFLESSSPPCGMIDTASISVIRAPSESDIIAHSLTLNGVGNKTSEAYRTVDGELGCLPTGKFRFATSATTTPLSVS